MNVESLTASFVGAAAAKSVGQRRVMKIRRSNAENSLLDRYPKLLQKYDQCAATLSCLTVPHRVRV